MSCKLLRGFAFYLTDGIFEIGANFVSFLFYYYCTHTDLHLLIDFIARMQGMGGTMMAGGMQQRMAVGGNPGKDR